jgi:hypothetical protein
MRPRGEKLHPENVDLVAHESSSFAESLAGASPMARCAVKIFHRSNHPSIISNFSVPRGMKEALLSGNHVSAAKSLSHAAYLSELPQRSLELRFSNFVKGSNAAGGSALSAEIK